MKLLLVFLTLCAANGAPTDILVLQLRSIATTYTLGSIQLNDTWFSMCKSVSRDEIGLKTCQNFYKLSDDSFKQMLVEINK